MIPLQLTLSNFLSYRQASLDFNGLHTACICGANGAGKSSLLEAITWVIWGKTRAATEDDVIHIGEKDVRVDFELMNNYQHYRVIRSRTRGRSSSLDFQVKSEAGNFISLSGKGLRNTQEQIVSELKLDYETFINSAYLRQGRADEFMLKAPSERKKVLSELLNLEQYQKLSEKAKDFSKKIKGKIEELEYNLESQTQKLGQEEQLLQEQKEIENKIKEVNQQEEIDREVENKLKEKQLFRDNIQNQINWQKEQFNRNQQEGDRLKQEYLDLQNNLASLNQLLQQEAEINFNYQKLLELRLEQDKLGQNFQIYQQLKEQKQNLEQKLNKEINQLNFQLESAKNKLINLQQQEEENKTILKEQGQVAVGLNKLKQKREYLQKLDELQHQVTPLIQQRQILETEIDKVKNRLNLKIEQLKVNEKDIAEQIDKQPAKRQKLADIDDKLNSLDNKKEYVKRIETKSKEQEKSINLLQDNQNKCQQLILELQQKLQLLQKPDAACPLCERELDESHRETVINKTTQQYTENQEQIWIIKEQISKCEKELQNLTNERENLSRELQEYPQLLQEFSQIEFQLDATAGLNNTLQSIQQEITHLESSLNIGNYGAELQIELQQINEQLKTLNYSQETHVLVRKEIDNLRWAEIKQAKIEDTQRRQGEVERVKPEIIANITNLEKQLEDIEIKSEIQQEIEKINRSIQELNYSASYHNQVISDVRQAQSYQITYQQLEQAKQQYPLLENRKQELEQKLAAREKEQVDIQSQLQILSSEIELSKDNSEDLKMLAGRMHQRRQELDQLLSKKGSIKQSLKQIEETRDKNEKEYERLQEMKKQYRIYQELGQAFSKNGIQALMIENILPQLEAETNNILSRLTNNQFHVQFLTQKNSKGTSKKKTKLIDTLDIVIADTQGTRTYETYSGGEAFRINFSIRLALAKLLAQRAGTSLQMLIIDEGFGTQDGEGCDRLIASINAISSDFSCILAVTHIPQFKEAFQTRIEIYKNNQGSQIKLSN